MDPRNRFKPSQHKPVGGTNEGGVEEDHRQSLT